MKILFVINNLKIGGIQKSLVDLLVLIAKDYDITLYCDDYSGVFIEQIPENVQIIEGNKFAKTVEYDIRECKKRLGVFYSLLRGCFSLFSRKMGRRIPAWIINNLAGRIPGNYDWAFSFSQPLIYSDFHNISNEIVLQRVHAEKKGVFIHCDYSSYGGDCEYNRNLLYQFDKIICVSRSVKERFEQCIPGLENKTTFLYNNCCCREIVEKGSLSEIVYNKTTIISISRLSGEKALDKNVSVMHRLIKAGHDFSWVIVGEGPMRKNIECEIKKYGMEEHIKLVGAQKNPYRYLKNANFLFLPSLHEAAPMVFAEAACFNVPILSTNTLSAKELVEDRHWGVVSENDDTSIYNMLNNALTKGVNAYDGTFNVHQISEVVLEKFNDIINSLLSR